MKKRIKKQLVSSHDQSDMLLDVLIKLTAKEFGVTENEVKESVTNFIEQNKDSYPGIKIPSFK